MAGLRGLEGGAFRRAPVKSQEEIDAENLALARSGYGDFSGGLASAARGMVGSTKAYAAAGLDAAGMTEDAAALYALAQQDATQAGSIAPEIATTDQIVDPSTLGRYVAGKVGAAAGSIPLGLAGGVGGRLLTRSGAGALAGSTLAYEPVMAGGHVQDINANPNLAGMDPGEKLARATGVGTAQSVLEGVGPAYMANRLFAHAPAATTLRGALGGAAKTVGIDAGLEGLGAAGSDALGQAGIMQADPTVAYNPRQSIEAGIGEAVGGAGMGVPHAAAAHSLDYFAAGKKAAGALGRRAVDTARGATSDLGNPMSGAVSAAGRAGQSVLDAGALFKNTASGYLKHPELATLVADQQLPPEMEGASAGEIENWLAQDDGQRHQAALKIAQRTLIDREASEGERQVAQALLDNPTDPKNWKPFADGVIAKHQIDRLGAQLGKAGSQLAGWVSEKLGKLKSNLEQTPQGAEFGDAMREPLAKALGTADAASVDSASALLDAYVASGFAADSRGEVRVPDGLVDALGDQAPQILAAAYDTLRRQGRTREFDAVAKERLAAVGAQVKARRSQVKDAADIVQHQLTPTMYRRVPQSSWADIADGVRTYLRAGKRDAETEAALDQMFGANKDVLIEQLTALDPKGHEIKYDASEGGADTRGVGEEDAGSDAATDEFDPTINEVSGDTAGYHFKGSKGKTPFDRADAFLAQNVKLAKDRMGPEVTFRYNKDTGTDEPYAQEVGVAKHARETGNEAVLNALQKAHPELTRKQLDERFFVLQTESRAIDNADEVNIDPAELRAAASKDGRPNKRSWRDVPTIQSAGGNRDVSSIEHGRIYLIPGTPAVKHYVDEATGEVVPPGRGGVEVIDEPATKQGKEFLTSAQKIITKMWQRGLVTDASPQGKLAAFAAGLASLHATGQFNGEMQIKLADGTTQVVNNVNDLPDDFVLYQANGERTTVKDARGTTDKAYRAKKQKALKGAEPAPKRETDQIRISDIPNMTREELRAAGEEILAALKNTTGRMAVLDGGAAHKNYAKLDDIRQKQQALLTALREAYDKRVTDRAPGEKKEQALEVGAKIAGRQTTVIDRDNKGNVFSKATARSYAGENDRVVKQGDRWVVERDIGHKVERKAEHLTETEEMSAAKEESERRFDEETDLELHPKEIIGAGMRATLLDQQAAKLRAEYKALHTKIKEFEGKEGKNAVREANLRKWRADLAAVMEKGKALAAQRESLAKPNLEQPGSKPMTAEQKAEVSAYVEKTLGPKVAQFFTDQLRGSGEWSRDANNQNATIKIATSALNPLSVAHHEAMHEFFQRLLDGKYERAANVLRSAASSPLIQRQLERHFAGQTEVLSQIENDVEERIAYMFQLWAAGKLNIGTQTETVFRKIINVIRKTLGMVSQEKQLEEILQSFHDGKMAEPSAMAQVLDSQEARAKYLKKVGALASPALKKANEWVGFAENALTGNKNPHLDWVGRQMNNKTGSKGDAQGFLSAKEQANNLYMNKFANALKGADAVGKDTRTATKADVDLALEGLQTKTWHADPVVLRVQQQVAGVFEEMMQYMKDRGVKVLNTKTKEWDEVREVKDYRIPRAWDPAKIIENSGRFKELLLEHHERELERIAAKANKEVADGNDAGNYTASWDKQQNPDNEEITAEDVANAIVNRLINSNGQEEVKEDSTSLGFSPFAKAVNERTLHWIDDAAFSEFMEKDIVKIISSYVGQVTKRGEYSHRFGADGNILQEKMDAAMDFEIEQIKKERPDTSDEDARAEAIQNLEPARRAIMAMEGTLGHDISAWARKASAYTIVYQNVRLLGFALFSNVIDPLGMMVRGAEFKDAYAAFKRGMRDVGREWGSLTGLRDAKETDDDEAVRVAEMIGTVDSSGFMSQMGTAYGSQYLPTWAKNTNDTFFRWNGLEAFNRAMRVQATQAAISFIKRHHEKPNEHSARYFEELGLSRDDVQLGPNGELNVDNRQVQQAVMRWVDGAILRPNAAIRPTMSSDPHYAVFYHLKQFMYAMHAVILKRVQVEIKNGNTDPLLMLLAGYVPVMLAADSAKGLIQEAMGGGAPVWQHEGVAGVLAHGVQRAGLLGVGQMVPDAVGNGPLDLAGPAVEQAAGVAVDPLSKSVAEAAAIGPLSMLTKGINWAVNDVPPPVN